VIHAWIDAILLVVLSIAMTFGQPKAYVIAAVYWVLRYLKLSLLVQLGEIVDSNFSPVALLAVLIGLLWLIFPLIWFVGGFQVETLRKTKGRAGLQADSPVSSLAVSNDE